MKILVLVLLMAASCQGAYAESLALAGVVAADAPARETRHTISAGLVKSVSWKDPAKADKSEIIVLNDLRKPTNIYITATTTLWDSDAKAITPDRITVKARVNVIYITTPEGINVAESVKIVK